MNTARQNEKSHELKAKQIFYTNDKERRKEGRKTVDTLSKAWIEVPFPFGAKIVKEIIDFSEKGLSFKMAQEEGFLLPGTVIKNATVCFDGKWQEKPFLEVMYATPQGNGDFKIGVKWTSDPRRRSALGRKAFTHALRPMRHNLSNMEPQQKTIHFTDHNGLHYSGILKNISEYGLAFALKTEPDAQFLRLGDTINPFEVQVGREMIYDGKVTIAMLRSEQDKTIVGVSFGERCESVHDVIRQSGEADQADESPISLKLDKIDTSFKALVADLRYVLETVQEAMEEEEKTISRYGTVHRNRMEKVAIKRFERPVFNYFDDAMIQLNGLVCNFDEQTHAYHREYFQKQLGTLIWQSPFAKRAYTKPLGYAGDYEMMDMIYRNPYEGDTLYAKLMQVYFTYHIPPAKAVRNRVPLLLKKIEQVAKKGKHATRRSRILSLACGPANEVLEFINQSEASNNVELTLIDIEPEALYFTQEMVLEAIRNNKRTIKAHIYYLPLMQLLTQHTKHVHLTNRDLIYCMGLFDYFPDRVVQGALKVLYQMLSSEGRLIVGNFDPCNTFKGCLEYCLEWPLIYRSQEELVRLAKKSVGSTTGISCEAESTGINNFLIIER